MPMTHQADSTLFGLVFGRIEASEKKHRRTHQCAGEIIAKTCSPVLTAWICTLRFGSLDPSELLQTFKFSMAWVVFDKEAFCLLKTAARTEVEGTRM